MAARKPPRQDPGPESGFRAPPADGGISIDRLAQAFAAMMGSADAPMASAAADVVSVDASPDLDENPPATDDDACRVTPVAILEALERHGWRRDAAARALGINRTSLYKKLKRLGMDLAALEPAG